MTTAKIVFSGSNKTAPLYCKFQGQSNPQPAHVTLDLRNGQVDADYSGEIGGISADVYNNRVLCWPINQLASGNQVQDLLEGILPTLQIILDGSEVEWDGNNMTGRLVTPEAIAAADKLDKDSYYGLLCDVDTLFITDLEDWLANGGRDCWMPGDSDDIEKYISDFDLDGYSAAQDVRETLIKMWSEELYSGLPLQKNVAEFLLAGGHCDGSAWIEELTAYANGEQPE